MLASVRRAGQIMCDAECQFQKSGLEIIAEGRR